MKLQVSIQSNTKLMKKAIFGQSNIDEAAFKCVGHTGSFKCTVYLALYIIGMGIVTMYNERYRYG